MSENRCVMEPHDVKFYEEKIRDYLPDTIIDVHTHMHLKKYYLGDALWNQNRGALWPRLACGENPAEEMEEFYRAQFPGKTVIPLVFGKVSRAFDVEGCTAYAIGEAKKRNWPYLYVTKPDWSAEDFEEKIERTGAKGAKVYLNFAPTYIPGPEIRILDFIPHHQLEVLNRHGWVLMLHIPREGRLGDPVNIEEMCLIARNYPNVKVIIAHIGRAYTKGDIGNAFERLPKEAPEFRYDFSANINSYVMEELLKAVGPDKVMFGTDSPINRMRMGRIEENGTYINLVRKGQYQGVDTDPHMREIEGPGAAQLTWYTYYEIESMLKAMKHLGMGDREAEKIFYENAKDLLGI